MGGNIKIFFVLAILIMTGGCKRKNPPLIPGLMQPLISYQENAEGIPVRRPVNNKTNPNPTPNIDPVEDDFLEKPLENKTPKTRNKTPKEEPQNPSPTPSGAPSGSPFLDGPPPLMPPPTFPERNEMVGNPFWGVGMVYSLCGNGIVEPREECDDGNGNNLDGCSVLCTFPVCGNGLLEKGEECDLAPYLDYSTNPAGVRVALPTPGCTVDCKYRRCGNGVIDCSSLEQCDDGNRVGGDGCDPCCMLEEICTSAPPPIPPVCVPDDG